jgi:hypothetical protein
MTKPTSAAEAILLARAGKAVTSASPVARSPEDTGEDYRADIPRELQLDPEPGSPVPLVEHRQLSVKLSTRAPVRSIRDAVGLSYLDLSEIMGNASSWAGKAAARGPGVRFTTLLDLADALGYRIELHMIQKQGDR